MQIRVEIHVQYKYMYGFEPTAAEHLGAAEPEGELYRVVKPSFAHVTVPRGSVIRTVRNHWHDGYYRQVALVERSRWRTVLPIVTERALGTPSLAEFRAAVEAAGCVWEGTTVHAWRRAVISVPHGVSDEAWRMPWERLLIEGLGTSPSQIADDIVAERRERREAERRKRESEERARTRSRVLDRAAQIILGTIYVGVALVVVGSIGYAFVRADASTRPQAVAWVMLAALAPLWVVDVPKLWPLAVVPTLSGAAAVILTRDGDLGLASAAGLLNVFTAGAPGVFFGIFSLFASSSREWVKVMIGVVLPLVVSGAAGLLLALTSGGTAIARALR